MSNDKKQQNLTLIVLAFVMFINALSAGIIIPLLYPYSSKFGINPLGLSLLFAVYSLFQFFATPIIGRLSDRFGRKPMLLLSIFGTAISLAMTAAAQNVFMLFLARILDGITGGNISVAQAMIADKTTGKNRTKGFGVLGAMFGLGFLIGPAIGGFMSEISLSAPFWLASSLALLATLFGIVVLKETLPKNKMLIQKKESLFNYKAMISALLSPTIGFALMLTFISYFAHQVAVLAFQAYSVDDLKLSAKTIGIIFASIGAVMVVMKSFGLSFVINKVKNNRKIIISSFLISSLTMLLISFSKGYQSFLTLMIFYVLSFSFIGPVVTGYLSKRVKEEDQGVALGINQSYASLGQIFGPISAGLVSQFSIRLVFVWSSILLFIGFLVSYRINKSTNKTDF